jgi:uncharacterized protein (TIGR03085 family)
MTWHQLERAALAHALTEAGPGAPTLCEGWQTQHLAAHVVLRERAPLVAAGISIRRLAARTERATQSLGDRSVAPQAYAALVATVASGPPRLNPMTWLGDAANLLELYVHTEDVRRAGPEGGSVPPRTRPDDHDQAMWRWFSRSARMMYRGSPVGVVLRDDAGREVRAARPPSGSTDRAVVVGGPLGELVLHAFGRGAVAHVRVEGSPEAVARMDGFRPR